MKYFRLCGPVPFALHSLELESGHRRHTKEPSHGVYKTLFTDTDSRQDLVEVFKELYLNASDSLSN